MDNKGTLNAYIDEQNNLQVYDNKDRELLFVCKNWNELWDELVKRNCGINFKGYLNAK